MKIPVDPKKELTEWKSVALPHNHICSWNIKICKTGPEISGRFNKIHTDLYWLHREENLNPYISSGPKSFGH
jgi:hypothetical protein